MTGSMLAVDLINRRADDREEVEQILRSHGIRRPGLTSAQAGELLVWTEDLRRVFLHANIDELCESINDLLARGTTRAYLTRHDALRPHLHFASDEDDVVSRVKAVTAGSLAVFAVEAEGQRLGTCQRAGCSTVFLDVGRNARRRYCTPRCGNYDAVQRHRATCPPSSPTEHHVSPARGRE